MCVTYINFCSSVNCFNYKYVELRKVKKCVELLFSGPDPVLRTTKLEVIKTEMTPAFVVFTIQTENKYGANYHYIKLPNTLIFLLVHCIPSLEYKV